MKTYSTLIVLFAILMIGIGGPSGAQAGLSEGDSLTVSWDPVSYWVVDTNPSDGGSATLTANSFGLPGQLQYDIDGSGWLDYSTPIEFDIGDDQMAFISFQFLFSGDTTYTTGGEITFQSYDEENSSIMALDLFDTVVINWDSLASFFALTVSTTGSDDRFALAETSVPIPTTALLLSTGLIGLIGFRRRKANNYNPIDREARACRP